MKLRINPILRTDSYKITHWNQEPEKTSYNYNYMESRGGLFPYTMQFGNTFFVKEYLLDPITYEDIEYARDVAHRHFGTDKVFNRDGFTRIVEYHGGYYPMRIMAVPEGTVVPFKNVLYTCESLDPKLPWVTHPVETPLMRMWSPITVGTNALYARKSIHKVIEETGGDPKWQDFKLHDFGARGVSSEETACINGAAFLAAGWTGSDNLEACEFIKYYYNWNEPTGYPAYSVVASEHAVALLYGKEHEKGYVKAMLTRHYDLPVSVIGDTWNIYNFLTMCHTDQELRNLILNRPAPTIFRLDSGDPVEVILKSLNILWNGFGGSYNDKHFKILHPNVKILQGDGISRLFVDNSIIPAIKSNGWCFDVFGTLGSGGKLLQVFGRDDNEFAIKNSFGIVDGQELNMFKDPITGSGKKSKPGKLKLTPLGQNSYMTVSSATSSPEMFGSYADALVPIYETGKLLVDEDFTTIQARATKALQYLETI